MAKKKLILLLKYLFQRLHYRANRKQIEVLFRFLPAENGVFIDIGSNCGIFSFWAAFKMRRGGGEVHAFEPQPEMSWVLPFLTALFPNVKLQSNSTALSDRHGTMMLTRRFIGAGGASLEAGIDALVDPSLSISVPVSTLDHYVGESDLTKIDAIKIDVEHHELSVLKGAMKVVERFRPAILMETDPNGPKFIEASNLLIALGYRYELVVGAELIDRCQFKNSRSRKTLCDVIFTSS